jgi:hypothetical protein
MSTISEFEIGFVSAEGQITFGEREKERYKHQFVDERAVERYLAAARRYQKVLTVGYRLVDDCNYLVETWKELEKLFSKYSELKEKKGGSGAFREAFKDFPYQEKSTEKSKVEKTQMDNLRLNFNRIFNMLEIKKGLKGRIDEYRSMTKVIASPSSMLAACGFSAFTKEIGASAEEYGGNYMLAYSRPMIFGELFPSHNESTNFIEWNRDALKKMETILTAEPSLELLEEIMSIESPMFESFRQDRIDSENIIEEAIAKADAEKKKLAEKNSGRNGRPMQTRNVGDLPAPTRTLDEYNAPPSRSAQPEQSTKSVPTDRSRWSEDTTSTYRPPQRRQQDDYVPKSPPPKPANSNGWQTVSKGRKSGASGK